MPYEPDRSYWKSLWYTFNYYDKPEGQDPLGKVLGCAKYGLAYGTTLAMYDHALISKVNLIHTFGKCMNMYAYWIVPLTGMGIAFASVTYIMTNMRKKDDHVNYTAGTLASLFVYHAWQKNHYATTTMAIALFACSYVKKDTSHYGREKFISDRYTDPEEKEYWSWEWLNMPERDFSYKPRFIWDKKQHWQGF